MCCLPSIPAQVERYLGEVERQAALLIQRVWRGHRERRVFQDRRFHLKRHKAAVTIQRAVSGHLTNQSSRVAAVHGHSSILWHDSQIL